MIGIQPAENISLSLMAKVPGLDRGGIRLRAVPLDIAIARCSVFSSSLTLPGKS